MKRLLQTALALCLVCVLSACRQTVKVDTSAWRYYSFEELGFVFLFIDAVTGGSDRVPHGFLF